MQYEVQIEWDVEAKVWYIEDSNIPGLVGEATTLEAMMTLLQVRIPEMLEENNCPRNHDIPLRLLTATYLAQMQKAA
jgi:predicted RNase H-like HicB family nuclease